MGGHKAGEVASAMAVSEFTRWLRCAPVPTEETVNYAVHEANRIIHRTAQREADKSNMGTTLVSVWVDDEQVIECNVGDSRAYLLRGGALTQISRDHSLVGELVEEGTPEQVIFDPINPYTHALMGSIIVPEDGMKAHKLTAIPGAPPNLKRVPPGCRFRDRCAYAREECARDARVGITRFGPENSRYHRCVFSEEQLRVWYGEEKRRFGIGGGAK